MPDVRLIPIADIRCADRVRQEYGDIATLARSIQDIGLLQPIIVDLAFRLIAGARRLKACELLGWTEIAALVLPLPGEG